MTLAYGSGRCCMFALWCQLLADDSSIVNLNCSEHNVVLNTDQGSRRLVYVPIETHDSTALHVAPNRIHAPFFVYRYNLGCKHET